MYFLDKCVVLCMLSQFIPCFIYSYDLRLFLFLYAHMLMIHNCVTNVLTISPPDATHRLQQPQSGADKIFHCCSHLCSLPPP